MWKPHIRSGRNYNLFSASFLKEKDCFVCCIPLQSSLTLAKCNIKVIRFFAQILRIRIPCCHCQKHPLLLFVVGHRKSWIEDFCLACHTTTAVGPYNCAKTLGITKRNIEIFHAHHFPPLQGVVCQERFFLSPNLLIHKRDFFTILILGKSVVSLFFANGWERKGRDFCFQKAFSPLENAAPFERFTMGSPSSSFLNACTYTLDSQK